MKNNHASSDNHQTPSLVKTPLEEAWITIRWQLKKYGPSDGFQKDEEFPIALGNFAKEVQNRFTHRVAKKENEAPLDFLPYIPRYQFRVNGNNGWPLVQLGPGIATLNYTYMYNWSSFLNDALFLREKLLIAYQNVKLKPESISLKYRNAFGYNYKKNDLLSFLREKLNFEVRMPEGIPGKEILNSSALDINFSTVFDIKEPKAQGIFTLVTGYKTVKNKEGNEQKEEHLINDIEIISKGDNCPDYYDETAFKKWVDEAHKIATEWFFSLIKGDLLKSYTK